jgi:N-acetyl-gamma-glutamyl-phosphate reductase
VALAAIDNLGKGAAGQALQNANLMMGQPESAGLLALPLRP